MFGYCPGTSFNSLSGFGALGTTRVQTPEGLGVNDYYRKGTKFQWIAPADSTFEIALDPGENAKARLIQALASAGFNVSVVWGGRNSPLQVQGSQGIDRAKGFHVRDQITGLVQQAGFGIGSPILFSIETPSSNWRVGSPGATDTWGDQTPVAPVPLLDELGLSLPDLAGDSNFLGGTFKNLAIYAGLGLLAFFLVTKATR